MVKSTERYDPAAKPTPEQQERINSLMPVLLRLQSNEPSSIALSIAVIMALAEPGEQLPTITENLIAHPAFALNMQARFLPGWHFTMSGETDGDRFWIQLQSHFVDRDERRKLERRGLYKATQTLGGRDLARSVFIALFHALIIQNNGKPIYLAPPKDEPSEVADVVTAE